MSSSGQRRTASSTQARGVAARSTVGTSAATVFTPAPRGRASHRASPAGRPRPLRRCRSGRLAILASRRSQHRLHGGELARQLRHRLLAVLVDDRHRVVGTIGLGAGEHLEHDDSQAVQVAALVDRLAMTLLRAHVVRGAEDHAGVGDVERQRCVLGQAEIDERDAAVLAQHDVAGLEIAVQHAGSVHRRERAGDRDRVAQGLARLEPLAHAPPQVAEREILHDQPGVLVAHTQIVETHHRGAVDALYDLVLLQEAPEGIERAASARPGGRVPP